MVGVEECTEIRAFVKDPEALLARCELEGEYALVDRYFVPSGKGLEGWDPAVRNMRIRQFGDRGNHLVYSIQEYRGKLKDGKKFYFMEGDVQFLEQVMSDWGFEEVFQIRRNAGNFIKLDGFSLALEEIDGLGWMVDAHIEPGELDRLKGTLGIGDDDILDESLPSYYWKNVVSTK